MIQVTRLNHVSLLVADTQRALDFYHGVLGLAIDPQRPELGFPGAWLDVGDGRQIHLLELAPDEGERRRSEHGGRDRHVALEVDSLGAVTRVLELAGVDYTHSRSGRRALFCRDPDGNALELIEA
ncbi:MAG: VOC family protein [Gammaproteobacteria bacterium]